MAFKIGSSPMAAMRDHATNVVNGHYDMLAARGVHRAAAQARKREIAASGAFTPEFAEEAELRGLTAAELAAVVLSKSADIDQLELQRQKLLLTIEVAPAPPELDQIMADAQIVGWAAKPAR